MSRVEPVNGRPPERPSSADSWAERTTYGCGPDTALSRAGYGTVLPDRLTHRDGHVCAVGLRVLFLLWSSQVPDVNRAERRRRKRLYAPLVPLLRAHGRGELDELEFGRAVLTELEARS